MAVMHHVPSKSLQIHSDGEYIVVSATAVTSVVSAWAFLSDLLSSAVLCCPLLCTTVGMHLLCTYIHDRFCSGNISFNAFARCCPSISALQLSNDAHCYIHSMLYYSRVIHSSIEGHPAPGVSATLDRAAANCVTCVEASPQLLSLRAMGVCILCRIILD